MNPGSGMLYKVSSIFWKLPNPNKNSEKFNNTLFENWVKKAIVVEPKRKTTVLTVKLRDNQKSVIFPTTKLISEKYQEYSNIYLWTVDERHVDKNDENSNQKMINTIFGNSKLNIIEYDYHKDPKYSADSYTTAVLSKIDRFNAAILGVGEDGHIASLFPNTPALEIDKKGFVENEVNIISKWRITSTFQLLKNVEHLYLLVTGENKKEIIQQIGKENNLPVNELIRLRKKTILLTDQKI